MSIKLFNYYKCVTHMYCVLTALSGDFTTMISHIMYILIAWSCHVVTCISWVILLQKFAFCRFWHTRKETRFSPKSLFKWTREFVQTTQKVCSNSLESLFDCSRKKFVSVQKICLNRLENLLEKSWKIGPQRFEVRSFVQRLVFNNMTPSLIH
jgi:hypothetical protein